MEAHARGGPLRVALAQVNSVVGDLTGNVRRCGAAIAEASRMGADVCVLPELVTTGYPPEDLLLKSGFVADNEAALGEIAASVGETAAVVGYVRRRPDGSLANAAALCHGGAVAGVYEKRLLPNYGVFDEERYFTPGVGAPEIFDVAGRRVGLTICEDIWFAEGPAGELAAGGAEVILNVNSSPYSRGRRRERLSMLGDRVTEIGVPIVYVNQVGGQDELVFDGGSMVVGPGGDLLASARQFVEDLVLVELPGGGPLADPMDAVEEVYEALVVGTRDYLSKNGFERAVIGLSGGIDSSLVAAIAVDALGAGKVLGVSMPSRYSSAGSRDDAADLARRLGIELETIEIEEAHRAMGKLLGDPEGLTDENLQSRLRGVLLMGISNSSGRIVLTTGNKSEMATGYSTLYGDSAGGFAVIKDVSKSLVYELCAYRNSRTEVIPPDVLTKPPSAELRPDQRDDQSLPPYELLDPVLEAYVEMDKTAAELVADGFDAAIVAQVVRLVDGAEYKRRQMPPGVRISEKAFGKDRRMPITNRYRAHP